MPVLQPAELWKETGRYGLDIQFQLEDRKGSEMVLAMTHEECLTFHVAREVRSYRDLPLILYHLQVKERDEPRPRAGVLRSREFVMKDSYSFDRDTESFERSYEKHIGAYDRIFDRCGLDWYRVDSDVGMMGGSGAHEYMAPCPAGEDSIALAPGLCRQRRGRLRPRSARRAATTARSPRAGPDAGPEDGRGGRVAARPPRGRAGQVAAGRGGRRAGLRPGPGPRRSPPRRGQAPQRARGRLPSGPRGGDLRAARAPGLHRAGRCRCAR